MSQRMFMVQYGPNPGFNVLYRLLLFSRGIIGSNASTTMEGKRGHHDVFILIVASPYLELPAVLAPGAGLGGAKEAETTSRAAFGVPKRVSKTAHRAVSVSRYDVRLPPFLSALASSVHPLGRCTPLRCSW